MSIQDVECLTEANEIDSEFGVNIGTYSRVNFVNTETRVQVRKWRDRWPDPRCRECRLSADICRVVGIENLRVSYERTRTLRRGCDGPRTDLRGYGRRRYLRNRVNIVGLSRVS